MSTKTRFKEEAKGNSEMAYYGHFAPWSFRPHQKSLRPIQELLCSIQKLLRSM